MQRPISARRSMARGYGRRDAERIIRVGLEQGAFAPLLFLTVTNGRFHWLDIDTGRLLGEGEPGTVWQLQFRGGRTIARANGKQVSAKRLLADPQADALLTIGAHPTQQRRYRGTLEWILREGKLLTINWVPLDDYLKAVLPVEMPKEFPLEALKAQAVASRSFTLRRLNRYREWGYDLCDHQPCQLYGGVDAEHPITNEAVDATERQVILYAGAVFDAVYFSNCGGHTAPIEVAMPRTQPLAPLRGVPDRDAEGKPFCALAPNLEWSFLLTPDQLAKAFPSLGTPRNLTITQHARTGHVAQVQIQGSRQRLTLPSAELRTKVGTALIRSLAFTIERERDGWRFNGRGWGHGAGMCQWGAQGRALAGQTYLEILQAYYPGTTVGIW